MSIKALIKIVEQDEKGNLVEYKPGTIVTLSNEEEKRLIKIKAAEATKTNTGAANTPNQENNNSNPDENGPSTSYPGK